MIAARHSRTVMHLPAASVAGQSPLQDAHGAACNVRRVLRIRIFFRGMMQMAALFPTFCNCTNIFNDAERLFDNLTSTKKRSTFYHHLYKSAIISKSYKTLAQELTWLILP